MPCQLPQEQETVRRIKIEIGKEWQAIDFGRDIPHADAMARARQMLETFDRKAQL